MTTLKVVMANSALRLRAVLDIEDEHEKRVAGDEWLFEGPGKTLSDWVIITVLFKGLL